MKNQLYAQTNLSVRPRTPTGFSWAIFFELCILVLVCWLTYTKIQAQPSPVYLFIATAALLATWTLGVGLHRFFYPISGSGLHMLLVPAVGLAITLAACAVFRTYYSLTTLGILFSVSTLVLFATRLVLRRNIRPFNALLVGESPLANELAESPLLGLTMFHGVPARADWDIVISGALDAEHLDAYKVWIAEGELNNRMQISDVKALELFRGRIPVESINQRWKSFVSVRSRNYARLKRVLDVAFVVILSPLLLLITLVTAAGVLLVNGRPLLFKQPRTGLMGESFIVYKFRSMREDSESNGPQFAGENDSRITPFGRFIRKFRLDELPQFWNVLRGDMSIIGPRPEQVAFTDEFNRQLAGYELRHLVRPGITGWAQVTQGYAAGIDETEIKLSYDLYYLRHQSLWLDIMIVARTIGTILTGFGSR